MYDIAQKAIFDDATESYRYITYYPNQGSDLNGFSDLRIHVQGKDYFYHPCNSYLTIKGCLKKKNGQSFTGTEDITIINNGIAYLFSKMTLRMAGSLIESIDYPGQTSSLFLHLQNTSEVAKSQGLSMTWFPDSDKTASPDTNTGFAARKKYLFEEPVTKGNFTFILPLKNIFGFCADYDRVIRGYDFELILVRQNDYYALFKKPNDVLALSDLNTNVEEGKIDIKSITWRMPITTPNVAMKLHLLEMIKDKIPLSIHFRERKGQCIDIPLGLASFDWQFSTISLSKRPKYLLVGFQNQKKTDQSENYALFSNANVIKMRVSINNTIIGIHDEDQANFSEMQFEEFYRNFTSIRQNIFCICTGIIIAMLCNIFFR